VYLALARMGFQRQLAYRTANLAGLATNSFFGLLRAYVLIALYGARPSVAGYSLPAAITYTALSQALIAYIAIWSWWDIIRTFRTGEIATDLSRPCDYFRYWFAQDVGRAAAQLLLRGLPLIALYAVFYRIVIPATLLQVLALLLSLALALLVSFSWRFLVSLAGFWVGDATGVGRMAWTVATFLSGQIMPLAMFPAWATGVLRATPWAAMINTPVEVYLGLVRGPHLLAALAVQAAWAIALIAFGRLLLRAGVGHLAVQGG